MIGLALGSGFTFKFVCVHVCACQFDEREGRGREGGEERRGEERGGRGGEERRGEERRGEGGEERGERRD